MNKYWIYWWLIACLQVLGLLIAWNTGAWDFIISIDYTKITLLILGIHTFVSGYIGWLLWKRKEPYTGMLWYAAETQLSIGMIGTLIGFIIMTHSAFGNFSHIDIDVIKTSIGQIGSGMGIAIRATLLGITSSALLKLQLELLERSSERK